MRALGFFLLLLALAAPAAPAPAARFGPVAAYLDAEAEAGFSGTVLVARRGVLVKRAYGLADREFEIANKPSTRFRIGSLTKQFTAAAILLLVQDGKLSLDDRLCRFVEPCPAAWRAIRIEQLLNHSSGIPDFVRLPGMRERFTLPAKLDDTVAMLARQPLDFPPGSDARYGNSGYLLAAYIIEKVSGATYAGFVEQRIYRPLGMSGSGYASDAPIIPRRARGYVRRAGNVQNAPYIDMSIPIGAGSQYSTVDDLYRWDRALRGSGLLSPPLLERMFAPGLNDFGLGWEIGREQGRRVFEHNGDINGFGAFIARYPDDDAVILILSNMEGTRVRKMKEEIARRLFEPR
ncbi:MAG: serine hydrolase domain-containing protein [Allosphingosinicella sp.]